MEGPKDELKWFGEGFDRFPKRLPDDCVEYSLFVVDAGLGSRAHLHQLEVARREAARITKRLLKDYIWQREEFNLEVKIRGEAGLRYLHNRTNYGDSVDDEWLIVFILRELSQLLPKLWIRVVDTDGEFLLIEAANALPRWLNPEIADNRVWINGGKLHLIPLTATPQPSDSNAKTGPVSRSLTLDESLKVIKTTPELLIHSPLIEAEAFYRLKNYPAQITNSLHHAQISVPRKLAYILHNCPSSIAPAVEAFYLRDPIAMKQLQKNGPELLFPPEDLATTSVRFTKVLYAQVKSQKFSAPPAWKEKLLQAEEAANSDHVNQMAFSRLEIGMKVACGFEMLIGDPSHQDNRSVQKIKILLDDLEDGTSLPTDAEISSWPESGREDDEGWLDINFEDFERELAGKQTRAIKSVGPEGSFGPQPQAGFGDANTQANLKKMVQRFEAFLNDDKAGIDGAEVDDMDVDDDDDEGEDKDEDEDEDDSEDEDKAVSFDEGEFARMMREMMGMPSDEANEEQRISKTAETQTDDEGESNVDEGEEIRKVMQQLGAELKAAGALELDPKPRKPDMLKAGTSSRAEGAAVLTSETKNFQEKQDGEEESDEEVNIDFNLAKNILESFKGQAGMAGPGGNLMNMMGMPMPRDEGEDDGALLSP